MGESEIDREAERGAQSEGAREKGPSRVREREIGRESQRERDNVRE